MTLNPWKSALVVVFGAIAVVAPVHATEQSAEPTVAGVWQVTRHGIDCNTGEERSSFPALMTFHKDGTVATDVVAPGATAAEGTGEHGAWQREPGPQNYSFRMISYSWDNAGDLAGSTTISAYLTVTGADSFAYSATIRFFDSTGTLQATRCGTATGDRFR